MLSVGTPSFAEQYLIKIESSENAVHSWSGKTESEAEQIFACAYPAIHKWLNPSEMVN